MRHAIGACEKLQVTKKSSTEGSGESSTVGYQRTQKLVLLPPAPFGRMKGIHPSSFGKKEGKLLKLGP